ncbi:MAG TPA: DNA-formamidopyrimidine glycosylase family protein [Gemmatimonadales bacterium]|nr:DNA-formamidopyrimidine glycosylase family protein [Gemmatimonadales bacterium]
MPELPDVVVYLEALRPRIVGRTVQAIRIASPFVLRSVEPPLEAAVGRRVAGVSRLGKRIVIALEPDLFLVIHLMIAGRLRWRAPRAKMPGRIGLAAFDFENGSLVLTEAGTRRRAGLHLLRGAAALAEHDPGGLEVLESDAASFRAALRRESHTIKRALTDPHIVSGIGNAYSDEILHSARLSPFALTSSLSDAELDRLYAATRATLDLWLERLRRDAGDGFPDKVTAFREGMAVHGRYREPCPVCGSPVQRIRYAENEVNYCATCQTGGRVLADRSLSRLLKDDWPRSLDEWEERVGGGKRR